VFLLLLVLWVSEMLDHGGGVAVAPPSPPINPISDSGCQTWDYFLDTWRIVPERLSVKKSTVEVSWHIADIYIPGTPGADNEDFDGSVSIRLDDDPVLTDSIFSRAHDSERLRTLTVANARSGQHHLVIALWQHGFELGQFESCFKTPSQQKITHKQWRDLGGEGWQSS
jgi:hypothetical protein